MKPGSPWASHARRRACCARPCRIRRGARRSRNWGAAPDSVLHRKYPAPTPFCRCCAIRIGPPGGCLGAWKFVSFRPRRTRHLRRLADRHAGWGAAVRRIGALLRDRGARLHHRRRALQPCHRRFVFVPAATGRASWQQAIGGCVFPALTGNIPGGVSLVAALHRAQVFS